ncbi:hypothetical protein [Nonomuraea typhae]|uniref:hypothetical protein n=1 Tax=Nonomuraea typhae TaxID=2603600 RepID=UPI0012F87D60|nr:hypothetical protein [Nonomuraea typhae]
MAASYPSAFRAWSTKFDYTTIVFAEHVNTLQDELLAVQRTLGTTPQIAASDPGSTPYELLPIVEWIGRAPETDIPRIIDVLTDRAPVRHNYDPAKIRDCLLDIWPDWGTRYPSLPWGGTA